jgi:hypothetical protein
MMGNGKLNIMESSCGGKDEDSEHKGAVLEEEEMEEEEEEEEVGSIKQLDINNS